MLVSNALLSILFIARPKTAIDLPDFSPASAIIFNLPRLDAKDVNKLQLEGLTKAGVFDEFEKDRKKILKAFASKFGAKFDKGKVRKKFLEFINERIIGFGSSSNEDIPLLIPFEIELEIDGIGGIYPANSFHSTYLPTKYQESVIFQAKDVNHRVDATGWTTTLVGVMRTTLNAVLERNDEYKKFKKDYFKS